MSHGFRNIFVILCIAVITAAIGAGLYLYFSFSIIDAALIAAIGFCVLLVLHNNLNLQRHFQRTETHFRNVHQFEQAIAGRIKNLENIQGPPPAATNSVAPKPLPHEGSDGEDMAQNNPTGLLNELSTARAERNASIGAPGHSERDNIIALDSRKEQIEQLAGAKPFKIKPSQLAKALEKGGTELYLQPILELPSRDIRYFEAFVRLRIGDNILSAKQFLPTAKDSGQIAKIDLLSLELTFKVVRGLQRQDNDFPVFWNVASQTLGNKKVFKDILEMLRANQPLNGQLVCEISYPAYNKLNTLQSENLAAIRDLGYELSLDRVSTMANAGQPIEDIIEEGMFGFIKLPAIELMRIVGGDIANFAERIVPLASANNVVLIASEVESDAQTVAMIDADIFLAQGDALMPARALKKELGGT
ncbi:MAG: EAL domain-containing protein [Rhizobiaceae bacterium]|nr:EAL domain-containing protein [Rhizobiaceae bacterium]